MKLRYYYLLIFIPAYFSSYGRFACLQNEPVTILPKEAKEIGLKIWHNECRGTIAGLTSWNKGENFASLGIGHFIWRSNTNKQETFKETFPQLLEYLAQQGKKLPPGILKNGSTACPWNSREEFLKEKSSKRMVALRNFLANTIDLQINFILERLIRALPQMLKDLSAAQQEQVKKQFYRMVRSPGGNYALVDYVNFKGEGLSGNKKYKGYRWGLLQVLQKMKGSIVGPLALKEFVHAAKEVLRGRVAHAPKELQAQETQWLLGWENRLNTYLT